MAAVQAAMTQPFAGYALARRRADGLERTAAVIVMVLITVISSVMLATPAAPANRRR